MRTKRNKGREIQNACVVRAKNRTEKGTIEREKLNGIRWKSLKAVAGRLMRLLFPGSGAAAAARARFRPSESWRLLVNRANVAAYAHMPCVLCVPHVQYPPVTFSSRCVLVSLEY